jgi:hypothetical protein
VFMTEPFRLETDIVPLHGKGRLIDVCTALT